MRKILSFICVVMLVASQCQAAWWVTLSSPVSVSTGCQCTGGTAFVTQSSADSGANTSSFLTGQSFTVTEEICLYSISIFLWTDAPSGTITMRIGTTTDLSSTYTEEIALVTPAFPGAGTELEFISVDNPVLPSGTYYFMFNASQSYSIARQTAGNPYSGGSYRYGTVDGWSASNEESDRDLKMVIKSCDD